MDAKIGSPTFYTWGLKSIHESYNIHTFFPIIASSVKAQLYNHQLCSLKSWLDVPSSLSLTMNWTGSPELIEGSLPMGSPFESWTYRMSSPVLYSSLGRFREPCKTITRIWKHAMEIQATGRPISWGPIAGLQIDEWATSEQVLTCTKRAVSKWTGPGGLGLIGWGPHWLVVWKGTG